MGEKSYAVRLSVNTSSPISCDWAEEAPEPGVGDQMVVRSQPELPRLSVVLISSSKKSYLDSKVLFGEMYMSSQFDNSDSQVCTTADGNWRENQPEI